VSICLVIALIGSERRSDLPLIGSCWGLAKFQSGGILLSIPTNWKVKMVIDLLYFVQCPSQGIQPARQPYL
jgi:hypothetical protein